jgi:RNA polymerase sigma factor (TIGR02999 family)
LYDELRALCALAMRHERNDHTLQPTALAHEVYLRVSQSCPDLQDPRKFRIAASRTIRRILIEHARRHGRSKRGGGRSKVSLDQLGERAGWQPHVLLELNDAINALGRLRPRAADVFEMTLFGGLQQAEICEALGVCERTVRDDWSFARAWLAARLTDDDRA